MRNTGKQIRAVPTWTQAEREKTDIPVRNTLSQLHWLHHSVNTQHRQAVIANIWRVWVYKKWTKAPAAVARLCVFTVWRRPGIRFPPPYTLWPRDIHWVSPFFFPQTDFNYRLWRVMPTRRRGRGSDDPRRARPNTHFRETTPPSFPSIISDHMWKMGLDGRHANDCHSGGRPATDFINQNPSSSWMSDGSGCWGSNTARVGQQNPER